MPGFMQKVLVMTCVDRKFTSHAMRALRRSGSWASWALLGVISHHFLPIEALKCTVHGLPVLCPRGQENASPVFSNLNLSFCFNRWQETQTSRRTTWMSPLQCSFLENPRDGGAWWAAIHGVTQSRTRLKRLSSSSSSSSIGGFSFLRTFFSVFCL